MYSFFFFKHEVVMVPHHEHVKAVLSATTRRLLHESATHVQRFFGRRSLIQHNGEEWRAHRKIMFQAFKFAQLQTMATDMVWTRNPGTQRG